MPVEKFLATLNSAGIYQNAFLRVSLNLIELPWYYNSRKTSDLHIIRVFLPYLDTGLGCGNACGTSAIAGENQKSVTGIFNLFRDFTYSLRLYIFYALKFFQCLLCNELFMPKMPYHPLKTLIFFFNIAEMLCTGLHKFLCHFHIYFYNLCYFLNHLSFDCHTRIDFPV